jgi:tetratricopeptide (TPR) repeat protein
MEDPVSHAENLTRLGIELQEKKRFDDAVEAFTRALEHYPDFPLALLRRGHVRLQQKRHHDALADIERVLALDSGDQRAWAYRGLIHQERGDDAAAIADFNRALEIREAGSILFCRGFSRQRLGHHLEAADDFRRANELAEQAPPDDAPATPPAQ